MYVYIRKYRSKVGQITGNISLSNYSTYSNISIFWDKYHVTKYFMTMLNKMGQNMGRNFKGKVKKYGKYVTKY